MFAVAPLKLLRMPPALEEALSWAYPAVALSQRCLRLVPHRGP